MDRTHVDQHDPEQLAAGLYADADGCVHAFRERATAATRAGSYRAFFEAAECVGHEPTRCSRRRRAAPGTTGSGRGAPDRRLSRQELKSTG